MTVKPYGALPIEDLQSSDIPVLLSLNHAHAEQTSCMNEKSMAGLLNAACYARGLERGGTAFLIALDDGGTYENQNFQWFKSRGRSFVYVDRIIVSDAARGKGLGRLLYQDLFRWATDAGHNRICCEVNLVPPNEASHAFHRALGFTPVGEARLHNSTKTVRYLEKVLGKTSVGPLCP